MRRDLLWQDNVPPVSIGIHLAEDGWRFECPVCKEGFGPYEERGYAARVRGGHLVAVHGGENFNAGRTRLRAQRHAAQNAARKAAKRAAG